MFVYWYAECRGTGIFSYIVSLTEGKVSAQSLYDYFRATSRIEINAFWPTRISMICSPNLM